MKNSDTPWNRVLYHFVAGDMMGRSLVPIEYKYMSQLPTKITKKLNIVDGKAKLLWAATHKTKALALGMRKKIYTHTTNISMPDKDYEFTICGNCKRLWIDEPLGTLFAINGKDFIDLPSNSGLIRQAISQSEVGSDDLKIILQPKSVIDLMCNGLQLLTDEDKGDGNDECFYNLIKHIDNTSIWSIIKRELSIGNLCWENKKYDFKSNDEVLSFLYK